MNQIKKIVYLSVFLVSLGIKAEVNHLTSDQIFQDTIKSKQIAFIDFYAEWCQPCKTMHPRFEKIAEEFPHIFCAKINIDQCQSTAATYAVRSIPTFILFKDGKKIATLTGACSLNELKTFIKKNTE